MYTVCTCVYTNDMQGFMQMGGKGDIPQATCTCTMYVPPLNFRVDIKTRPCTWVKRSKRIS